MNDPATSGTVRILLADDHNLVRESLAKTIAAEPAFTVVGEAATGPEVLPQVLATQPDILVLDIAMPGEDGISVATKVRAQAPEVRVLFMTMHDDDTHLKRAMALDVAGFVSKRASASEFLEALHAVAGGETYLSSDALRRVMGMAAGRVGQGLPNLSAREEQVLDCLVQGQRPANIAETLFLSIKTVKNHLSSIYVKLNVETAAQAVAKAYRIGLARVPEDGLHTD